MKKTLGALTIAIVLDLTMFFITDVPLWFNLMFGMLSFGTGYWILDIAGVEA